MAEASIEQYNPARHVADDTLQSLNLKPEDNLNDYIILIVGNHDQDNLFKELLKITSEDHLKTFDDIKKSLQFVDSQHQNTNIFLIISGTLGKTFAHEFDTVPQIIYLYVYCMDEDTHAIWTKENKKICCTVSNAEQLLIRLHADIKQFSGRWPILEKSFQKAAMVTSERYHLFLLAVSHRPECVRKSYKEMFDECRMYYEKNQFMKKEIDKFAQMYTPDKAILEYTRDSFLYRIVNRALRTQDMQIIEKFSLFLTDLHSQLHNIYRKDYKSNVYPMHVVYRGQLLSVDELKHLRSICKSKNPVIKLTTFGSASLDPEIAMNFAASSDDRIRCLFEITITDEYKSEATCGWDDTETFANISSFSQIPAEQEVLFSLLTHFRVKQVYDSIVHSADRFVIITLELIHTKMIQNGGSYVKFIELIKKETNPQHYADILNVLKVIIEDKVRFNNMDWKKWWSNLAKHWGRDGTDDQPLLLTLYQCFHDHKDYSRKAVEMHKDILRSVPSFELNKTSFSYLFKDFKIFRPIPTKSIAIYEQYLEQFCTSNAKEFIECLLLAGETYQKISDKERALECYEKVLALDESNEFQKNDQVHKLLKELKKPSRTDRTVINEHQKQGSNYLNIMASDASRSSIELRLDKLLECITHREEWYDMSDSKIILRLSFEKIVDLSVKDYRLYFMLAAQRHISSISITTDAANNRTLSFWRYEKYMHDWILFKALENFLEPFKRKSKYISSFILPRLERVLKKLSVLITICTVYIWVVPWEVNHKKHKVLGFSFKLVGL